MRRWLAGALLASALSASPARADEVPLPLQVQLLSKMAALIDLPAGTPSTIKILILYPGTLPAPSRGALTLSSAIAQTAQFGSAKAEARVLPYLDAAKLALTVATEKPQLVYLAPEFPAEGVPGVVQACSSGGVVTLSSVGEHVKLGIILGFSLVEAHPQVLLNLKHAREQNIGLHVGLTRHAVVVER